MSNLTRSLGIPQIRCRAMPGGESSFLYRYEAKVLGCWVAINYPFARWVVDFGGWIVRNGGRV